MNTGYFTVFAVVVFAITTWLLRKNKDLQFLPALIVVAGLAFFVLTG